MFAFEQLNTYQQAKKLAIEVYRMIDSFPDKEKFSLSPQLRRAIISVPSNIAEGVSRHSPRDQAHFIEIAYGSLMESFSQLQIAKELNYVAKNDLERIRTEFEKTARLLSGLRNSMVQKVEKTK